MLVSSEFYDMDGTVYWSLLDLEVLLHFSN